MDINSNQSNQLEESPLLARRPLHSTINVGKLDQARFSEIRQSETDSNPVRIIIYVVIVVLVGLGVVLIVRNLIIGSQNTAINNTNTPTPPATTINNGYVISKIAAADSEAGNITKNADYIDSTLTTLGDSTSTSENTTLDKIYYTKYTTFARVTFDFTTSDKKLPKTTANFDSVGNKMTLTFAGLTNINNDLKTDATINDLVSEIRFLSTTNAYVIMLSDDVKYKLTASGDNLTIDFKTLDELAKPDTVTETPTPAPSPTPVPTPPTSPSDKPAAPHYTNEYSQSKQYVSSNVTGNTLSHNVYYVDSYAGAFGFSVGQKNVVGDSAVPNAVAYLDESTSGKIYLFVEVSNLKQEVFKANGVTGLSAAEIQAKTGVNTQYMNFYRIDVVSFANGTAKYRFDLKKKADFKLLTQKTVDGKTQVVGVEVKN